MSNISQDNKDIFLNPEEKCNLKNIPPPPYICPAKTFPSPVIPSEVEGSIKIVISESVFCVNYIFKSFT